VEEQTVGTGDLAPKSSPKTLFYCEEGRRLLEAFGSTVQELVILHEQQFFAITHNDSESDRFDLLIHMAIEKKQQAKYAYLQHLDSHGCSTNL
jgi:hypothetical protein